MVEEAIETTVETAADTVDNAIEKITKPKTASSFAFASPETEQEYIETFVTGERSQFGKTNKYGIFHEEVAQYAKDNFLSIEEAYARLDKIEQTEEYVRQSAYTGTQYGKDRDVFGNPMFREIDFDENGNLIRTNKIRNAKINKGDFKKPSKFWNQADDTIFSKGMRGFNVAANIVGTVATYKNARRQGHGVISSAARAGVDFAIGEALGMWAIPLELVKNVPTAAIKGTEALYKENRRMNAAANNQAFSNAQFADNQQLATMRQSSMELAKMSQYNLQQAILGTEASHLHR